MQVVCSSLIQASEEPHWPEHACHEHVVHCCMAKAQTPPGGLHSTSI